MTRSGWKFPLAATLAVLVNLGGSRSARADAMEVTVTSSAEPGTLTLLAPAGATTFTFNSANSALMTMFPELAANSSITISDNQGSGFAYSSLTNNFDFYRNGSNSNAVTYTVSVTDVNFTVPAGPAKVLQTTVSGNFNGGTNPPATYSDVGSAGANTPFNIAASNSTLGPFVPMSTGLSSFPAGSATSPVNFSGATPFSITNVATFTTNLLSETTASAITTVSAAAPLPEPSSFVLGAFALPLLVFLRRRRAV